MVQQEKYGGEKSLDMAFMRVLTSTISLYKKHLQGQNNTGNHNQHSHVLKSHQGAFAKKTPQKTSPCQPDQQAIKKRPKNIYQNTQKQHALTITRTDSFLPFTAQKLQKHPDKGNKQQICMQRNNALPQHFKRIREGGTFYIKSLTHPHQHPLSSKEKIDARAELSI